MSMETTQQGTKKFSKDEKLAILAEGKTKGVKVTLEKYDLYPATYYYWKNLLEAKGEDGLNHANHRQFESEIKILTKENSTLKILLAEKELEGRLKDDLLKKKYPELKRRI